MANLIYLFLGKVKPFLVWLWLFAFSLFAFSLDKREGDH